MGDQNSTVGADCACDKSVSSVDRTSSLAPLPLVATCTPRCFKSGGKESQTAEEGAGPALLRSSDPTLDLRDIYAGHGEGVPLVEQGSKQFGQARCVPQVANEDGGVQDVGAQPASVRRWVLTQSLMAS